MPKSKKAENRILPDVYIGSMFSLSCTHFDKHSEIEAYNRSTSKTETLADVYPIGNVSAEETAEFIRRAIATHIHSLTE